ncbi:hypothetical protein BH09ACT9_BH09ACT9_00840 [soil metagenome]
MPSFTGNLKDLGQAARHDKVPYLKFTAQRAGVGIDGNAIAGSTTVYPDASGDFTVTLASTVGLVPNTLVKMQGGWLGDDSFFELPPFQVPEVDGTLSDLIALADLPATGIFGIGFSPPPDWFNGFAWIDISVTPALLYPREF